MGTRVSKHQSIDGGSLVMGVVTGGAVAAAVALYFSPRPADVRAHLASTAADWQNATHSKVQMVENDIADVLDGAADVADEVSATALTLREELACAVECGAHALGAGARHVEHIAKHMKAR